MHLVCVESASVRARVSEILEQAYPGEFQVAFTAGRIFDLKLSGDWDDWQPLNNDIYGFLKASMAKATSVIAFTDPDEQGELIAHQLREMSDKPFIRVKTNDLTEASVIAAITNPCDVDVGAIQSALAERYMHFSLAKHSIEQGYGSIGLIQLAALEHREFIERPHIHQTASLHLNGQRYAFDYLTAAGDQVVDVSMVSSAPPVTIDLLRDAVQTNESSLSKASQDMQELYEQGMMSYLRVDTLTWHPSAEASVIELVEKNGASISANRMSSLISDEGAHGAIHLTGHPIPTHLHGVAQHVANRTINAIAEGPKSLLGITLSVKTQSGEVVKAQGAPSSKAEAKAIATPEQSGLALLEKTKLGRASTYATHGQSLSNHFFSNKPATNLANLNRIEGFGIKHCPRIYKEKDVIKDIFKQLKPINSQAKNVDFKQAKQLAEHGVNMLGM